MAWRKEAITDGEVDALQQAALAACNDDTQYPLWRGSSRHGNGQCLNIALWLVSHLGGHVGADHGHYVWLSPDASYSIDLTGNHGSDTRLYTPHDGRYARVEVVDNERSTRFVKRANRIFDSLDKLLRLSLDYAGDAYPAEEPQRGDDLDRFNDSWTEPEQYWHDENDPTTPEGVYQFIFANGQLEVSPNHSHDELAGHVGIEPSLHRGPFAAGHVAVTNGQATWEVQANVNLHSFLRILKDATKNYGWKWGGMTDANGQPITDSFGPSKKSTTYHYAYIEAHLYIGTVPTAILALSGEAAGGRPFTGTIRVSGTAAAVDPHTGGVEVLPALFEWAEDNGLTLYAGNDNVIKTIPDLQQHNLGDPQPLGVDNPTEPPSEEGRLPTGLYRCPGCSQLFPSFPAYARHRPGCAEWADPDHMDNGDRGLPDGQKDPTFGDAAHFTEQRQEPGITTGRVGAYGLTPEEMPPEQWQALHGDRHREGLAYATNPLPGTRVWRGELRVPGEEPESVGMHWSIDPGAVIAHKFPREEWPEAVPHIWQAALDRPEHQIIPRNHPIWGGKHRSMNWEGEVRLRPQAHVGVEGVWTPSTSEPGHFWPFPNFDGRTPQDRGWQFTPVGAYLPVRHEGQGIDYKDVGVTNEGPSTDELWEQHARSQQPNTLDFFNDFGQYNVQHAQGNPWGVGFSGPRRVVNPEDDSERDPYLMNVLKDHYQPRKRSTVVLVARSWKEAARVDGFMKYAAPFQYANDDYTFYVAYDQGDPIGYAAVKPDGYLHMLHSSVENRGAGQAIFHKLTQHFDSLYTGAMHDKSVALLKRYGWVQADQHRWKWSKGESPKDLLEAEMPFIYDVQEDKIHVGHPGARTADIPGRFTPGGIVEGTYEPGGKVVLRSLTSIPYTVRHMIELWYYTQPTLEVKSVHLRDDAGKDTRLAAHIAAHTRTLMTMDPAAYTAAIALNRAGGEVYAVGGAVRDVVLDKDPQDIDLMVAGLSGDRVDDVLNALPGKTVHEGKSFAVFHYRQKDHEVQIALPRREVSTGPGHTDFHVTANDQITPKEDLYRRDFTANAMAVNLFTNQLLDPYNGLSDIEARVLRTVSPESLAEDPLRIVRAVVAHARHGLTPDEETCMQMAAQASTLGHLPAERIQHELDKLMESDHPAAGIRLAYETGVLRYLFPEVQAAFGYDQNNKHHELHLGEHLLSVLERASERTTDPDLRLAALLHDIGKPESAWLDPEHGTNHYYAKHLEDGTVLGADHETVGADLVRQRLAALRYPKDRIARIAALVEHHMWAAFTTPRGARRFLSRVGDHADDLMTLRWADQGGKSEYPRDPALSLVTQQRLIERVRTAGEATTQSQLAITGDDLITAGIEPGPRMGKILSNLTERVLDDPALNTPDALLMMASANLSGDDHEVPQAPEARQAKEAKEALPERLRPRESQKLAQGDEEAEVAFPSVEEAQEIHDQAVLEQGQPHAALPDPGKLDSAMGRAANHYYYGDGTPGERVADAAGALAHGIGMAQAFVDGNKKTAYHTTRYFLHNNGYSHLSPIDHDDEEFADHLIGHGEGTHSLEDTQQLFRSRLGPEERSL